MKNLYGILFRIVIAAVFALNIFALNADAYESVIVKYPEQTWVSIYYQKESDETIAQFIPPYDYRNNWRQSLVFHSYKWAKGQSCSSFMNNLLANVSMQNDKMRVQMVKDNINDSIVMWCAPKNKYMSEQCEILRVTRGHEGLISIHYINRNMEDFTLRKNQWLNVIRDVKVYYSDYRWDRVLSKASVYEL